jgi:hypothetical protein
MKRTNTYANPYVNAYVNTYVNTYVNNYAQMHRPLLVTGMNHHVGLRGVALE